MARLAGETSVQRAPSSESASSSGNFIVFEDYKPPSRYPPLLTPWTVAEIQEADSEDGPWTTIDSITLDPVDSQPTRPQTRNFVTTKATLDEGWYRIVWKDEEGNTQPTFARLNTANVTQPTWLPSVQDVADRCPVYTRTVIEQGGQAVKTFTADTKPTDVEVQRLIASGANEVIGRCGVRVARLEQFPALAKSAVAWHAAASIEADKMPQGVDDTTSAFQWKQASYVATLNELITQVRGGAVRLA